MVRNEIDLHNMGRQDRKVLVDTILKVVDDDNEKFLRRLRDRMDKVGLEIPKIEVRYEHLFVEGNVHVGSRALPTLLNSTMNSMEAILGMVGLSPSKKRTLKVLQNVTGIVKPSRMTLLLGPPGAGKTTFLLALAGKLDKNLKVTGKVTYCGHELTEFVPQRTCAYISQDDLHNGELTVRETLDFSGRCLGVGTRYEVLAELSRREKQAGIKPDPEIDAFMKAIAMSGQQTSLVTDYVLKILGLDICADIIVGNEMSRGISGGQKKRVTTAKVLLMDEISTGLDSSTTFQICKYMRQMVHIMDVTMVISLLQPAPETCELFDDVILLSEAQVVYQGPREEIVEFFEYMGFKCPERKGIADFLQEVTSKKDQEQYWSRKDQPYSYISVSEFTQGFQSFRTGQKLASDLVVPFDKSKAHPAALVKEKYVLRLPIFYKQRDFMFYPAWAYALPGWVLRIPLSFMESAIWTILTYYTIGFAPSASRFFCQLLAYFCIHQMALSLFRFIGAAGRIMVVANNVAIFGLLLIFVLGGFIIAKGDIGPWMIWGYYISPMMYGQNALVINEFLDERWNTPNTDPGIPEPTIGKVLLASRGFFKEQYWFWISIVALLGFSLLFNLLYILSLTFLSRSINSHVEAPRRGMVMPFQPLSLAFNHVSYYVDMPAEMKNRGYEEDRLQLLQGVSGAFRPGILTALVGVSGAGKTTLMDVLAGRKTGGYIEGSISISGYPKNQSTFARICGYCEQTDIHSPHVTVFESLMYSAWLRLSSDVDTNTRQMFIEEVMDLIELKPLRDSLVGLPGVNGLSTEQRKRLTIAVELVANPSIIFMDEPTSGLDARAAAIVMRTVRNTVDTGRTVVCTIHQPSIDIFEAFDELLLMKRGGQVIYAGPLGRHSHELIEYFEAIPGVPKIKAGYNPATWMLDISTPQVETQLDMDFAIYYATSSRYQKNQDLVEELSIPSPGSSDLYFPAKYSQPSFVQFKACFWKQYWSYWRNPQYNLVRFALTIAVGLIFGVVFWNKGRKISKVQDLMNFLGAMYSALLFLGATNASAVQAVVAIERTVFYREKAAGMYSPLPYALAQVAIETIYTVIQTVLYTLILYSMIGFEWNFGKFIYFCYFITTCFIYFGMYGMMLVSLTPGPQVAGIVMGFFLSLWNLFAGFLIPRPQIPIWWRWYYWASPVSWTLYGLVTSQVGDKTSLIEIPGSSSMSVQAFLKDYLGYEYDFLPIIVIGHLGWVLLFFFVFAYGIKYLNFQKR
uniref:ABC transporter domain-containing protein n=1 Tax=Chenopodium quinoa TaxID=63459 RepID=A0A803MQI5_CHEQI